MIYEKLFIRISLEKLSQELSILAHTLTDSFTRWLTYTLTDYHTRMWIDWQKARLFRIDTKPSNFPLTSHIIAWFITDIYADCVTSISWHHVVDTKGFSIPGTAQGE